MYPPDYDTGDNDTCCNGGMSSPCEPNCPRRSADEARERESAQLTFRLDSIGALRVVGHTQKSRLLVLDDAVGSAAEHLPKGIFDRPSEWKNFADEMPPALALVVTRTGPLSEGVSVPSPGEMWTKYMVLYGRPEGQWRLANAKEKEEYRAECARLKALDAKEGA